MTVQEATELSRQASQSLQGGVNPFQNAPAPESTAGTEVQPQPEQIAVAQVTPPVTPVTPESTPNPVDVEKQIAAIEAQIAELEAKPKVAETAQGVAPGAGTAAQTSQVTLPGTTQSTAGPQSVVMSADTLVTLPDGTQKTWKEIDGERILQSKFSKEMRKLHEERETLDKEKQTIEKVKASPVGKTLIAALESGLSDDKVIEAGAAILGKSFAQTTVAEPEIPRPDDPDYEVKLENRSRWVRQQENAVLMGELASLRAELQQSRQPQVAQTTVAQQNQALFEQMIAARLPQGLSPDQQSKLRDHLVATGEQIDVPVDDYTWNRKAISSDQFKALYFAAFPSGQIPSSVAQPVQQIVPPIPKDAMATELARLQQQLMAIRQQAGLAPPATPVQPAPEAGPQPSAGSNAPENTAPQMSSRAAEERARSFAQALRKE